MARRQDHSHDEIRHMAIEAVEALLQLEPLAALSLRRVAASIGYAPSTLIKVFGNFHYLLLAVAARQLALLEASFAAACKELPPADALKAMVNVYGELADSHPSLFALIFELRMPDEAPLPESHSLLIERVLAHPEGCISALFPSLSPELIRTHTRLLWAAIHGLVSLSLQDKLFLAKQSISKLLIVQLSNQISAIEAFANHHREVTP